ncbi:hypothetical protein Pla108_16420 [Botrimarina colliarenosi]|uniref:Uncharacterized protein n=1 Tax=Botrimarina colliarenosi TaxID=2528001 RepID=A0A5C6AM11_9BACT|nr:hypothetical protein [Botrimarina colliarenosi]TWU00690.1 hypothetical protein Pla108_16420 [Botrimarina colliarenosi]
MNVLRTLTLSTVALSATLVSAQAPVAAVLASEAEVRSLPLHERPNRLGHFYGNTVRRRHYGTLVVNQRHSDRPVARYLYLAR